ncbi:MAG: DNA methyltransferase, partial [Halobacteriales archaeon]|nr:DNA methyltransferase [Halobacteriales archaeon]
MDTETQRSGTSPVSFFESPDVTIWQGDSRTFWRQLPERSVDAIVTSPPYFGLRDYGVDDQLGLEPSSDEYVNDLADLLTGYGERVLKGGGSLWLNLGDTYSSTTKSTDFPEKCLLMIPERVALALIARGWILRNKVVWAKPNGMP